MAPVNELKVTVLTASEPSKPLTVKPSVLVVFTPDALYAIPALVVVVP